MRTRTLAGLIVAAVFIVAALYSSVGHAGASGYLAVLALASWPDAAHAQRGTQAGEQADDAGGDWFIDRTKWPRLSKMVTFAR